MYKNHKYTIDINQNNMSNEYIIFLKVIEYLFTPATSNIEYKKKKRHIIWTIQAFKILLKLKIII